jgi:hypothetical protein
MENMVMSYLHGSTGIMELMHLFTLEQVGLVCGVEVA